MKYRIIDPRTGKEIEDDSDMLTEDELKKWGNFQFSEEFLKKKIDQLDISADAKSALMTISKITLNAGKFVISLGRKILDIVLDMMKEHPRTTFGLLFGAVLGVIIATIPILGPVVSPILTPVFMVLGMINGYTQDAFAQSLSGAILSKLHS